MAPRAFATDYTWNDGTIGFWNVAGNWTPSGVPNSSGDSANIDGGNAQDTTVTLNISATVGTLTITSGDELDIGDAQTLFVSQAIVNSGTLAILSTINTTRLQLGGSSVSLSGGGTVALSGTNSNQIRADVNNLRLVNIDNTIEGHGQIGNGVINVDNQGTIAAYAGDNLTFNPNSSGGNSNSGRMLASGGGALTLLNSNLTNTGTILATGTSSRVVYNNFTFSGGTLTTSSGGEIVLANNSHLDDFTNTGSVSISDAQTVYLGGTITNSGTISIDSVNNNTRLHLDGSTVTFNGGGYITLQGTNSDQIRADNASFFLVNSGNTINGYGEVGSGVIGINNQAAIAADVNGKTLTFDPNNNDTNTNSGSMAASGGGILQFLNSNVTNTGTIAATGAGSQVVFNNFALSGGTVTTNTGGEIVGRNNSHLDNFTNAGSISVADANTVYIGGTVTNRGTIGIDSTINNTRLELDTASVTLNGGGFVNLGGVNSNQLRADINNYRLINVDNTIQGAGTIGDGVINVDNQGTIAANLSGRTLSFNPNPSGGNSSSGTMLASGGGILSLGNSFTNTGTILSTGTNSVVSLNAVHLLNGTLTTSSGGVIQGVNNASLTDLYNGGQLNVTDAQIMYISGTINNHGTIGIESTNNTTRLEVGSATATLTGGGFVNLEGSNTNQLRADINNFRLTNVDNTIQGAGAIGDGVINVDNQGTIAANLNGRTLTFNPNTSGGNTSSGTLIASNGGILSLANNFTNTGTILATGTNSIVSLNAVHLLNGTLATSSGGVIQAVNNASLTDLYSGGQVNVTDAQIMYINGTINNHGTIGVESTVNTTRLELGSASVTLTGGGIVNLEGSNTNQLRGDINNYRLINVDNTIQGAGAVGDGVINVDNQGTIAANLNGRTLTFNPNPSGGNSSSGTMLASGGGVLSLANNFTNTGTILSTGTNSLVSLNGVQLLNGTLASNTGGVIQASNNASLTDLYNSADLRVNDAQVLFINGTITNDGTIKINGTANTTRIALGSASVTLAGSGTVVLGTASTSQIRADVAGRELINQSNTIRGGGTIGDNVINLENGGVIDGDQAVGLLINPNQFAVNDASGTIRASGSGGVVMNNGTFLNNGIVEAVASALTVNSSVSNNSGGVLTGGTWRVLADTGPATLNLSSNVTTNNATILLSGTNATFPQLAGLTANQNRLTIQNGAALAVTGGINNSGSVNIAANSHLTMNGDYTHSGASAVTTVNGSISFNSGSLNVASGLLNGSGTIAGGLSNSGGHVSPGNSPGVFTTTGNYVQLSSGALDIEIGGPTVGTQYDQLHTNGTAQLNGTLNVSLINGFTPTQDNSFVILLSDLGISGSFATTNLPSGLHVVYDANDVRIVVPEPSCAMLCMLGTFALLGRRRRRR